MTGTSSKQARSSYKWVILTIICLTAFMGMYTQFQVAALGYKLMPSLNLTPSQFASILTAPMLTSVFLSIAAGTLADRFGVKKVVSVGFILAIAGTFLRIAASSYWEMFTYMFMCGMTVSLLNANITKILGPWFSQKEMGMAVGIYMALCSAGSAIGLAITAMFSSMNTAFSVAGFITLAAGILWILLVKDKPDGAPDLPVKPAAEYFSVAAKSKNVWLVGVALAFYWGAFMAFSGFLPNALTTVRGISPVVAGVMASVMTVGVFCGNILGPGVSDRLGAIKPVVIVVAFLGAVAMYCSWAVTGEMAVWILLFITGVLMGASVPMLTAFPMLLPEIGPVYAGSAGGLIATIQLLGAALIPSFIIAPIAGNNFSMIFVLSSICLALLGVMTMLLPELGAKARAKANINHKNEF